MQQKLRLCRTHCRSFIALWFFPAFVVFALLSARRAAGAGSRGVALISVLSIMIYAAIAQVPVHWSLAQARDHLFADAITHYASSACRRHPCRDMNCFGDNA
jgi:hypothetical protein